MSPTITMSDIIAKVGRGERASMDLTYQEATAAMRLLLENHATAIQTGAFLLAMRVKSESVGELAALTATAREYVAPIRVADPSGLVDIPTYAGKQDSWHALLPAAIVATAAGARVLLHGYDGVPGRRSTAAVASAVGIPTDLPPDKVAEAIDLKGMAYLDIALYHPPIYRYLELRKELGVRTFFQPVARLLNPARAPASIIGISHPPYFEKVAEALRMMGTPKALILRGIEGEPEVAVNAVTKAIELRDDRITPLTLHSKDFGIVMGQLETQLPTDISIEAEFITRLLENEVKGVSRDWVVMNAAAILYLSGKASSIRAAMPLAENALESGAAEDKLLELV
jgi:anthranilate phosphoribosyltransferase